ncbi:MAG: tRNA 2-thiouridine(34) synthase MnmA [Chthonomonas sp.]|nr:tRNA 2-thiouridine(34) synthase MnmA [Chthonomonas sp.]
MAKKKETVLVAMSGGVDSSVVAAILAERGYDVIGVTMQIWQESQRDPRHAGCCSLGAVEDARRVARVLGIPHYVVNFKDQFRNTVIQYFIDEYTAGRTPNPCVQCNKKVKFEALMDTMRDLNCDRIATGHYARVRRNSQGKYRLLRSKGGAKDQSYVLYMLGQEQLRAAMFPLGELDSKAETRTMAERYGLSVAHKPDSQEICFVSEAGGYTEFLRKERPETFAPGQLVDSAGRTLGQHEGVAGFTVGQRRGIQLTVANGRPLYVLKLDPKQNRVVVGHEEELLQREVELLDVSWNESFRLDEPMRVTAKIRYNMAPQRAMLIPGPQPLIRFAEPIRAVTPGQIAVAFRGESVVCGGTIAAPKS